MKFLPALRWPHAPLDADIMSPNSPATEEPPDLGGLVVVVTRPRVQGLVTARLLRRLGAEVMQFPVLDITALQNNAVCGNIGSDRLARADALIFVSANAVQFGMPLVRTWGGLAAQTKVFAIGQATAQALVANGVGAVICPDIGNDSEALLEMPQLRDVMGRHIVLVRGVSAGGSRTLLADTLMARGALLWPLECYQRQPVSPLPDEILELSARLQKRGVHGILVLSVETLDSLLTNIEQMRHSRTVTLLVSHPRIAAAARARGFKRIEVVPMGDNALPLALHRLKPALLGYQAEDIE